MMSRGEMHDGGVVAVEGKPVLCVLVSKRCVPCHATAYVRFVFVVLRCSTYRHQKREIPLCLVMLLCGVRTLSDAQCTKHSATVLNTIRYASCAHANTQSLCYTNSIVAQVW